LLTGLIAKEAVVGTLNAFYLNEAAMLNSFGGVIPAYAYLLFTLLYFPCVSVVATISKELSLKWALFSVAWSTGLAYMIAALFYQIATLNSLAWVVGLSLVLTAFFMSMRWLVQKDQARAARRKLVPTLVKVDSI
jgi:ferrous iron transport protein B